jgi:hypothetical protein
MSPIASACSVRWIARIRNSSHLYATDVGFPFRQLNVEIRRSDDVPCAAAAHDGIVPNGTGRPNTGGGSRRHARKDRQ